MPGRVKLLADYEGPGWTGSVDNNAANDTYLAQAGSAGTIQREWRSGDGGPLMYVLYMDEAVKSSLSPQAPTAGVFIEVQESATEMLPS